MGRGERLVEVPFFPRVGSVNGYVVRGRILMNLRAKISEGNEKIHFLHKTRLKINDELWYNLTCIKR